VTTSRRFCRLTRAREGNEFGLLWEEPDGLCLSAFLLLTRGDGPPAVLVGKMNPEAPWDHLGGINDARVRQLTGGWVLPASQLLLREGPDEAARRICRELLGVDPPPLEPPRVVSEVNAPRRHPDARQHWDLHFLYRGRWTGAVPSQPEVWTELRFVELARASPSDFARSHEEILEVAGLPLGPSPRTSRAHRPSAPG
jgi:ADP-ribose pyrophosphatase YjhB (NUDIX family)